MPEDGSRAGFRNVVPRLKIERDKVSKILATEVGLSVVYTKCCQFVDCSQDADV
jgi:hypothetical protein